MNGDDVRVFGYVERAQFVLAQEFGLPRQEADVVFGDGRGGHRGEVFS